jgi:hypothetical protein
MAVPLSQRLGNQALTVAEVSLAEAVRVGRVEPGDPRVERGVNDPNRLRFRRAPFHGQRHRTEPDHTYVDPSEPEAAPPHRSAHRA